jgi:hypothetical protein
MAQRDEMKVNDPPFSKVDFKSLENRLIGKPYFFFDEWGNVVRNKDGSLKIVFVIPKKRGPKPKVKPSSPS